MQAFTENHSGQPQAAEIRLAHETGSAAEQVVYFVYYWLDAMRGALLLTCMWLITGCRHVISEPYPAFAYGTVTSEMLPRSVSGAFAAMHPDVNIEKIETESFKGRIGQYRIWFRSKQGRSDSAIFDRDGRPVVAPGLFRSRAAEPPN